MKIQPSKGPGVFEGVDMDRTLVADAFASKAVAMFSHHTRFATNTNQNWKQIGITSQLRKSLTRIDVSYVCSMPSLDEPLLYLPKFSLYVC